MVAECDVDAVSIVGRERIVVVKQRTRRRRRRREDNSILEVNERSRSPLRCPATFSDGE